MGYQPDALPAGLALGTAAAQLDELRAERSGAHDRLALAAAQDEIERRITECEGHRALIDAVLAEREAETEWDQMTVGFHGWSEKESEVFRRLNAARRHRRAVVDSIGGA